MGKKYRPIDDDSLNRCDGRLLPGTCGRGSPIQGETGECCRLTVFPIPPLPNVRLSSCRMARAWLCGCVNVEEWDPREAMPRTVLTPPAGGSPMPDIPNWAWHEYGNRVGFWRFVEVFDALSIPAVLAINGSALAAYPAIVRAALDRNGSSWATLTQRNMQKVENERADIRKSSRGHRQRHRQAAARTGSARD